MKLEIRILAFLVCATLASAACHKTIDPAESNNPVGFRAMSQATWVDPAPATKAGSLATDDFGVWGIARHDQISSAYDLWGSTALTRASKNTVTQQYEPATAAYWLAGYKYTFLAIAPYTNSGVSNLTITPKTNQSAKDAISFTFNMANKYTGTGADYDFDLLGAAAQTDPISGGHNASQDLTFWHLLSQIKIKVNFSGNNAAGSPISGELTGIRLLNVDVVASYQITAEGGATLGVSSTPVAAANPVTVQLGPVTATETNPFILHVVPQDISDMQLYLDFKIDGVQYNDFKVNLNVQTEANPNGTNPKDYRYNESYGWSITIGPKEDISFKVSVNPWESQNIGNEIDII